MSTRLFKMLRIVYAFLFLALSAQIYAAPESSAPFTPTPSQDNNNNNNNNNNNSESNNTGSDNTGSSSGSSNSSNSNSGGNGGEGGDDGGFWLDDLDYPSSVGDHDEDNDGASTQDVYNNPDTFSTSAYDPDEIGSNIAAFVGVIEGESGEMEFVIVTNYDSWDTMQDAIKSGNDQAIDILDDGVSVHENTHIDDALNSNPDILDNASDGDVLRNDPADTALVESRALQNEVDFYNDILERGEYNGQELSSDTISLVERARDEAQAMLDYYDEENYND